ncbi:4-hydroxythreonine-4-phosphate dehydrogenase PdxA [Crocinitomicaceae bacterium CZZ-1]|uniref:4-hydroxythreonine-4-phosphate dehydrogenase PdxA n=1 Tax=Taishania pollutisoli TaxID=2766479 RepID=A0A8J6TWR4_9FLAO|nr:4-hydroxythreonine-4-phosphate dehydrogenase PdxA [Taishania pollutisoli]MBC9811366.1 4-hydroxythreonine-4-phosphate dehydrogenase PdxA [Taishania pollutisoli]NGF75146.1 4-hydroxythreonine-4-phosphate dehydrogenase PdxA [Fluviicola sp. SGL-29]
MEKEREKEKETGREFPVRVGISIGDINGIGPEVVIKALSDNRLLLDCTPVIYASNKVLAYHKKLIENQDFSYQSCKSADDAVHKKVNVINLWDEEIKFELGQPTQLGGKYAFKSLEAATQDLASGKIDVLVTAPISKEAMALSGFQFPGHTEYLANLAGQEDALMLMVADDLRVALVTTHVAIKEVSSMLTKERIVAKIAELDKSLRRDFGIQKPKIAVFGLNPHAGENGKMGSEENDIIVPAIRQANSKGHLAFGPYPADGFFGSNARNQFDAVLAMYHDQGLAAFKALAFEDGVNFTAGLPVVRTSPDHGTAFDIVGQNKASESSMRSAIYLAMDIYRNNLVHKEIFANPLPFTPEEKKKGRHRDD